MFKKHPFIFTWFCGKNIVPLLFLYCTNLLAGDISMGLGCNMQIHRTRVSQNGLPFQEIGNAALVSPSIFIARRFKNPRFEISLDISYIRYRKTYVTNINFNDPTPIDNVTTSSSERVPFLMPKLNYQLFKKGKFTMDISAGATYSLQFIGMEFRSNFKSNDSLISVNYLGDSPTYARVNALVGLQGTFLASKHFNIRLNIFNVFGGKKYIFRDTYWATDNAHNTRTMEYGIYGGFYCADIKLVYTY